MSDIPLQPDLETGRLLFARPFVFVKGCVRIADLPPRDRVEIAFAGRSNVGKSSLINALIGMTGLARTSNTPGRTQELNIFEAENAPLRIVDMPGYGFAQAPKPKVEAWTRLIHQYLTGRPNLRRVYVLVDGRHGPKANDICGDERTRQVRGELPDRPDQGRQAVARPNSQQVIAATKRPSPSAPPRIRR